MEKKLYCVKVTLYVMAENASEACVAATKAPFDIFECTARKAERVGAGWAESIPYNADDERTCGEIITAELALRPPAAFMAVHAGQASAIRVPLSTAVQPSPG